MQNVDKERLYQTLIFNLYGHSLLENFSLDGNEIRIIKNDPSLETFSLDKEVIALYNLKQAYKFLVDNLDKELNLDFIKQIHKIIGQKGIVKDNGCLRNRNVYITGVAYKPPYPLNYDKVESTINKMLKKSHKYQIHHLPLYMAKTQIFNDGNKRTAFLVLTFLLLKQGKYCPLTYRNFVGYLNGLVDYYEFSSNRYFKKFVKTFALKFK